MKHRGWRLILLLFVGTLCLASIDKVYAHGKVPASMGSLKPGRVLSVMQKDFLVPQGFKALPGPMFYLSHERGLKLSSRQKREITEIAKRIMPETIKEGAAIDRLKKRVILLSDGRSPFHEGRVKMLLERIGRLEAAANLRHLKAHRACLDLLTAGQKSYLFTHLPLP